MNLTELIDTTKTSLDANGIWVTNVLFTPDTKASKEAWERIHDFSLEELRRQRDLFDQSKIQDHLKYLKEDFDFTPETIYMEIGCGPSHIGDYLMGWYKTKFIGVDFNYRALLILKKYFEEKGYKDYILIHADIRNIPLKANTVDFIFGGGVIEHMKETDIALMESFRVLKNGGVSFNTVPAFNLFWLTKFWMNIPNVPVLRKWLEFVHMNVLKNRIFNKSYGYELSFTIPKLYNMHEKVGFKKIRAGSFAFHPSYEKVRSKILREFFYKVGEHESTCPFYFVSGVK